MAAPLKSYIDRILNVLAEIDNLGGDKKEIYKELAGDGYDRTVVSQVVGHVRKKAAKPGKFAEQSALFDLYLTEYEGVGTRVATHAAREQADYDQNTGEVHPSEAAMLPQTAGSETAVAAGAPEGEHSPYASEPIRRMSMTPLEPREAGGLKGFGFTVRFDEPDAALRPQTAGTETAVANSTPGSGAGTVDAGEANWPSEMTTASPANEPETIPPAADPTVVVSEAGGGDSALSLAAIPVADHSKPNPICRDPDDCGVYASWHLTCEACKRADAHRVAA